MELYSRTNQKLTCFPHDISINTTELILARNFIERVDYIDALPILRTAVLDFNYLQSFPDFINVSTTLETLSLNNNNLTSISSDYLNQLVALKSLLLRSNRLRSIPDVEGPKHTLKQLDLSFNELANFPELTALGTSMVELDISYNRNVKSIPTEKLIHLANLTTLIAVGLGLVRFPDVRPVRETLEHLDLRQNQIVQIDLEVLKELSKLKTFKLDDNNIGTVPNLCMRYSTMVVTLTITSNPIRCDHTARWMKIAEMENVISLSLVCRYPPKLNGVSWSDVQMNDLTDATGEDLNGHINNVTKFVVALAFHFPFCGGGGWHQ